MNPRDAENYLEFAYRMALGAGDAILDLAIGIEARATRSGPATKGAR